MCEACLSNQNTHILLHAGLKLRHCTACHLVSVVDPVTTARYDAAYVAERYEQYKTTDRMSHLRCEFVKSVLNLYEAIPNGRVSYDGGSLLDVGYGNGSFIRDVALESIFQPFGNDVNPTEYPGVRKVSLPDPLLTKERYRVITFFDALEHFESLQQVRRLSACTDWIFVTAPLSPYLHWMGQCRSCPQFNATFFTNWKHWRPGEHHQFFLPTTLENIFSWTDTVAGIAVRTELVHVSHFEDSIRGQLSEGVPNTFTAALRCHKIGLSDVP